MPTDLATSLFAHERHTSVVCKNKIEYNSGINGIEKWFLIFDVLFYFVYLTLMIIVFDNIDRWYKLTIVYTKCQWHDQSVKWQIGVLVKKRIDFTD